MIKPEIRTFLTNNGYIEIVKPGNCLYQYTDVSTNWALRYPVYKQSLTNPGVVNRSFFRWYQSLSYR